jgi:hypothetical protein
MVFGLTATFARASVSVDSYFFHGSSFCKGFSLNLAIFEGLAGDHVDFHQLHLSPNTRTDPMEFTESKRRDVSFDLSEHLSSYGVWGMLWMVFRSPEV